MYIDTHSHLYAEEFHDDIDEVAGRAKEAGVGKIILPDIDSSTRGGMLELCDRFPDMMFPLIGLHPTSVNENYKKELTELEHQLGLHKFYGIGECGIDLYWDKTYYKEQVKVFGHQLGIARDMDLPVVIHARESLDEIFAVLKKHPYSRGVLHCFPGNEEQARRAYGMGFKLGIGGVVTFKNSPMAAMVKAIGAEPLVLETDAPYLTPVPFRGKRNESRHIPLIAEKIAGILETDVKKIEEITTRNALNLFTLLP